jgi:hypothetical protein
MKLELLNSRLSPVAMRVKSRCSGEREAKEAGTKEPIWKEAAGNANQLRYVCVVWGGGGGVGGRAGVGEGV